MAVPKLWNAKIDDSITCCSVADFLEWTRQFSPAQEESKDGYFSSVWFRGHSSLKYELLPGVYRPQFDKRAKTFWIDQQNYDKLSKEQLAETDSRPERQRLNLERIIVRDFLQAGGHLLERENEIEAYFLAQHFGIPTRLLDWSTNPLIALFMAVGDDENPHNDNEDGCVYAIDPTAHLPQDKQPFRAILTPTHAYATDAIRVVMKWEMAKVYPAYILPIRPNTRPGRIERQAACFTLHSYGSTKQENETLKRCRIPSGKKYEIRAGLRGLSINQFTVYNTLDRLSREFRRTWGL